jgi:hypothetical protein
LQRKGPPRPAVVPAAYGQRSTEEQGGCGMADGEPRQRTAVRQRPRTADGCGTPGQKIKSREEGVLAGGALTHYRIFLLDERPECRRHVLEAWRQPLEEGVTGISSRGRPQPRHAGRLRRVGADAQRVTSPAPMIPEPSRRCATPQAADRPSLSWGRQYPPRRCVVLITLYTLAHQKNLLDIRTDGRAVSRRRLGGGIRLRSRFLPRGSSALTGWPSGGPL